MTKRAVAAIVSGSILRPLQCRIAGPETRLVSVGICCTFFFPVQFQRDACRLLLKITGDQISMANRYVSRVEAPRRVERAENAHKQAPAPDVPPKCSVDEGSTAHGDCSFVP